MCKFSKCPTCQTSEGGVEFQIGTLARKCLQISNFSDTKQFNAYCCSEIPANLYIQNEQNIVGTKILPLPIWLLNTSATLESILCAQTPFSLKIVGFRFILFKNT